MSSTLQPHELQHARPPCPSPTPRVHPNPCPFNWWCPPTISSSVIPFSSCPQSFLASGSFPMSQLFASGGQSTGVSALASFLPKNTQGWSPSEWTGWISLESKGLSRVFSNTTVQKHQFFSTQFSSTCHQDYISSAGDSKITLLRRLKDSIWSGRECLGDLTGTWICIADTLFLFAVIGRVGITELGRG